MFIFNKALFILTACFFSLTLNSTNVVASPPSQVFFSENFNSYESGTCIGSSVWSKDFGCVIASIKALHPEWDGNAVDGDASTGGARITASIANAPTTGIVELSFRAWAPTIQVCCGGYVSLQTSDDPNSQIYLQAWTNVWADNEWMLQATDVFTGSGPVLFQSPSRFMRDIDLRATLVLDYDAHEAWARLTPTNGSAEFITPKIPFKGAAITRISVYEDDRYSGRGMDVDDIIITSTASPTIKPTKGGNAGTVTMSLRNLALAPDTTVRLSAPGVPDIVGQDTDVVSPILTRTTFDLTGANPGPRDVVATPPSGSEVSLPNAFEVINGGGPLLAIDLVGNTRPRFRRDTNYLAVIRNIGFNDTYPGKVTVAVDESTTALAQKSNTIINSNALTSVPLLAGNLPAISPGGSQIYNVIYTPDSGICKDIVGNATDPCAKEREKVEKLRQEIDNVNKEIEKINKEIKRIELLRESLGCPSAPGNPAPPGMPQGIKDLCEQLFYDLVDLHTKVRELNIKLTSLQNQLELAIEQLLDCLSQHGLSPTAKKAQSPVSNLTTTYDFSVAGPSASTGSTTSLRVCPLMSWDPNEKVGPQGFGAEGYLSSSLPFAYTVHFENLSSANAAAQDVVVTDQLDADLDWTTLELGGIRFGDRFVDVPASLQQFSTKVDLRPLQNLAVNIDVNLEPKTGLVTWKFKTVDADTGGEPSDPAAGFLPPNLVPPEGEASVFFTVRAKEDAQTGTEIRNKATIVFDVNPPIETGQWVNTFDNTKPQSEVLHLNGVQQSPKFQVQWAGTDGESGVREYTVYVSENNGPATVLLNNTTETAVPFTGKPGNTYAFYSMAMDQAGNVEDIPKVPDTSTQIALVGDLNGDKIVDCNDLKIVKLSFGKKTGQAGFDPRADVNNDGLVNIKDLATVSRQLPSGTVCK